MPSAPRTAATDVASTDGAARAVAFGVTWLSYASYYLGRKGLSAAKTSIEAAMGSGGVLVGIDTAYLLAYAIGQAPNGWLGDRVGARRLIGCGMLLSAAACVGFGLGSTLPLFLTAMLVNGYAQSTGWPGNVKAMAEWFPPHQRGRAMGFWATCYQVGGIAATFVTAWFLLRLGWRWAFIGPGLLVGAVGLLVLALLRPGPLVRQAHARAPVVDAATRAEARHAVLRDPAIWCYGACYFFMKLIRYALLFWLPYYFEKGLHYSTGRAIYHSLSFEVGGTVGTVLLGLASDRVRRIPRAGFAVLSLLALAGAFVLYTHVAALGPTANVLGMALVGALLFGPDALITGAAVQDAAGPHAAALAAGLVSCLGSFGAVVQSFVTHSVSQAYGWTALFHLFVVFAVLAAICLVPALRRPPPARG